MKKAIKFGFGFAFGACAFNLCKTFATLIVNKHFRKKFDADPEFRIVVKEISPELYVKYRKEDKETAFD